MADETKIIPTTGRNNCGGRCLIYAHVQNGKIVKLTTDTPEAAGNTPPLTACCRGLRYHETFLDESKRLRYPMKRVGARGEGRFRRISWDEAVETILRQWIRIRDAYGPGSRYVNYATGVSGLVSGRQMAKRLLALDGGFLDYYNSYSTACVDTVTPYLYGTKLTGSSMDTLMDSRLILLWGHNPAETIFDSTLYYLRQAKEAGVPIICLDPRQSDTAKALADEWIGIRPGTDAALMDAMAYVIIREGLFDRDFIESCCQGFTKETMPEGADPSDCYFSYVLGEKDGQAKTPRWAEGLTGVPAGKIEDLARRYALARPAALIPGYGGQRHAAGEQFVRGAIMLACLTGNVGVSGGWAAGCGYLNRHKKIHIPSPVNPYDRSISVFMWTDAILRGRQMTARADGVRGTIGDPDAPCLDSNIKMILNLAGNCLVNQHSDINRTARILRDESLCEFIVVSDLFMTSSAKFADILLPGLSFLESENITQPWECGDFLGYNNRCVEPLFEGRQEYDWLKEVAAGLGLYQEFTAGHETVEDWLQDTYEKLRLEERELPPFEQFKREGVYRYQNNPKTVAFSDQRREPERFPFPTPSGRIEIYSPRLAAMNDREIPPIPRYMPGFEGVEDPRREKYPLQLVGWHTKRRCHSIHETNEALRAVDPQALWIHPADAGRRGIADGDLVRVYNDRGATILPAKVTERIVEGVTAMSQGAWYRTEEKPGRMAERNAAERNTAERTDLGGNINVLTTSRPTPLAKGNPQHSNLVEVERIVRD